MLPTSSPAPPPLTPGTLRIERVSAPSLAHFFETYAERQTPVIITNYSHIFSGMSLANIESACGQASVSASRRAEESGNWASLEQCEASRSLAEHMRELSQAAPADGADSVGIFDMLLFSVCPSLLEQHFVMPKYFAQDFMQRVPPSTALKYRDSWPSLFIGMNGTYGGLHKDVFGSAFWQYVVEGSKEWKVVDALLGRDLFQTADDGQQGGQLGPTLRQYHDVVTAGELLYVPGNSLHQVRNVGFTVALAGNFISRGNLGSVRAELRSDKQGGRYYTQIQQTVLAAGFNASVDVDAGDLRWAQYKQQWRHFEQQEGAAAAPGAGRDKAAVDVDSAVLVSGAGSEEANGCYTYDGTYNEHTQYAKREAGRAFELFHVGDSWWNIAESHVDGDGGHTTYYGFRGSASQALPLESAAGGGAQDGVSSRGWANYKPAKWRGAEPPPTVALSREGCTAAGARPVVRSFVRSWPDTP